MLVVGPFAHPLIVHVVSHRAWPYLFALAASDVLTASTSVHCLMRPQPGPADGMGLRWSTHARLTGSCISGCLFGQQSYRTAEQWKSLKRWTMGVGDAIGEI